MPLILFKFALSDISNLLKNNFLAQLRNFDTLTFFWQGCQFVGYVSNQEVILPM